MAQTQALIAQKQSLFLEQENQRRELNSLSPINKLPIEIKTEIFYNTLRPVAHRNRAEMHPFLLGKICRGWRQCVWSTPLLWTILHLRLSKDKYETQTDLLRECLSRTAECPISFCLDTREIPKTWISHPPVEVLVMLASVSAQWKEVEFFLPDAQICFDAIGAAEKSLPLLTTATVRLMSTERQLNLFWMTPQLSVLHLRTRANMRSVLAPWHQLREFSSEAPQTVTVEDIHKLLLKMPNLVRCSFKWIIPMKWQDLGVSNPSEYPTLEHLEYLELSFHWRAEQAPQILGPFKLPSLREVSLRGPFSTLLAWFPIMISIHSSHILEKFSLTSAITSDYDLIEILELIPSIKELRLQFLESREPYGELLTVDLLRRLCPPHAAKFLPNLRSLTYDGPSSLNDHMNLFRDALAYRFRRCGLQLQPTRLDSAVSQIQSVIVKAFSLVIDPGIQEDLDSLRREGLELRLN